MNTNVTTYSTRENGARALGLQPTEGVSVLITPSTAAENARAAEIAKQFLNAEQVDEARVTCIGLQRAEIEALKTRLREAQVRIAALERINEAAILGRRRFFGPVLMKPAVAGDWSGEVWLMDPTKRERGTALRFKTVAEVRALHPELWVIGTSSDGVMLDAWGQP